MNRRFTSKRIFDSHTSLGAGGCQYAGPEFVRIGLAEYLVVERLGECMVRNETVGESELLAERVVKTVPA